MLKRIGKYGAGATNEEAAAFGRLCVETSHKRLYFYQFLPAAAFGRLCVETQSSVIRPSIIMAAAFGRLCVETY